MSKITVTVSVEVDDLSNLDLVERIVADAVKLNGAPPPPPTLVEPTAEEEKPKTKRKAKAKPAKPVEPEPELEPEQEPEAEPEASDYSQDDLINAATKCTEEFGLARVKAVMDTLQVERLTMIPESERATAIEMLGRE